jgi:hypothetical protein
MKITFRDLRDITDALSKDDNTLLIQFLNSFEGKNTHEKFLKVLESWREDVAYSISFSIDEKNVKVTVDYLLSCFKSLEIDGFSFESGEWEFWLEIPSKFTDRGLFDISNTIKKVKFGDNQISFDGLQDHEKDYIISQFPPAKFNDIIKETMNNKDFFISLSNPSLNHIGVNFLNNSSYVFLRGLFEPYGKDYFREIIYLLSKKIDGNILMESTISDIEYYIEKINEDNREAELPSLG